MDITETLASVAYFSAETGYYEMKSLPINMDTLCVDLYMFFFLFISIFFLA